MDVFKIMEKEQYLSVIRLLFLKGKSRNEIKERLVAVYSDSSPSMETVKIWFNDFFIYMIVTRRLLMSFTQVLRGRLLLRIT